MKSSSTGVSRPNMEIMTRTLPFSMLISSTSPLKSWNGPSITRTMSPNFKAHADAGLNDAGLLEDGGNFLTWQRVRFLRPHEAGHAGGVAHHVPGVVIQDHVDQDVAGQELALHLAALSAANLQFFLRGDDDVEDAVRDVHRFNTALEVLVHLVLVTGVGVEDVPGAAVTHVDAEDLIRLGGGDLLVGGGFDLGGGRGGPLFRRFVQAQLFGEALRGGGFFVDRGGGRFLVEAQRARGVHGFLVFALGGADGVAVGRIRVCADIRAKQVRGGGGGRVVPAAGFADHVRGLIGGAGRRRRRVGRRCVRRCIRHRV